MSGSTEMNREVEAFLAGWEPADDAMRGCFQDLYNSVQSMEETELNFVARPGVSYSLRPKRYVQKDRGLFAIIDVIDDDPDERWLSVCFYGDMITDPEQRGEVIPGGLAGDDGYCFDMYTADASLVAYLIERFSEAWSNASA